MGFEQSIVVLPIDERQESRTLDRSRGEGHFPRCDRMTAAVETLRSYGAEPSARLQRERSCCRGRSRKRRRQKSTWPNYSTKRNIVSILILEFYY